MGKAKRGGVFGMIRGSVGPATYSIGKDGAGKKQQIIREKPVEVFNPRTRAQAIQRMKLVPITYAMNLLGDIVNHSFRGVAEGLPSKRYFMSLAMKELDIPFLRKGTLNRAIGGYQISAGTLGDTRSVNQLMNNVAVRSYGDMVPCVNGLVLPTDNHVTYASWCQDFIAKNPQYQNGDEIAVLYFITKVNAGIRSVELKKFRLLLDTNFTTDTPDEFKRTAGEGEQAVTWDFNAIYAASTYNEDIPFADFEDFMDNTYINIQPGVVATRMIPEFLSIQQNYDKASSESDAVAISIALLGNRACFFSMDEMGGGDYVPQTATQGAWPDRVAAAALICSRREGDSWNYTISDICLSTGYLATVNTPALLEQAVDSYMTDAAEGGVNSDYYLQLTQEQAENYAIASFAAEGTISITGTDTAVKSQLSGRLNPIDGKVILFVNADGYVINDGSGADANIAYVGFRWRNASTGAYITPSNYVKAEDISNDSNITFARLVD